MAGFSYQGMARIEHTIGTPSTEQFITHDAETGELRVWPVGDAPHPEYVGTMADHPSVCIVFLHS